MIKKLQVVLLFALTGCVVENLSVATQISRYSGDGIIRNTSLAVAPGYRIEFPRFDSARPYEASYRISNLPKVAQWRRERIGLYLRFYQPDYAMVLERMKSVTAIVRCVIFDSTGRELHSDEIHIGRTSWGETARNIEVGVSDFKFGHDGAYVLRVSYVPGKVPPPAEQLFFSIEEGGTK